MQTSLQLIHLSAGDMQALLQRSARALLQSKLLNLHSYVAPTTYFQEPVSLPAAAWRHWLISQAEFCSHAATSDTSKIACLNGVRGVLHLGGEDVHHFLNVRTTRVNLRGCDLVFNPVDKMTQRQIACAGHHHQ